MDIYNNNNNCRSILWWILHIVKKPKKQNNNIIGEEIKSVTEDYAEYVRRKGLRAN